MGGVDATQRQAFVLRLARQVTARHDLDDVLTETFRALRPLVTFAGGSIQLLDEDGWIRMATADPVAPAHVMSQRVPLATSIAGRVILTEQPVYLPDLECETLPSPRGRTVSTGVRSYLGVPLVADGAAIGLLQVDSPEPDAWDDSARELFLSVAPIVAAAIQNARAHARAASARAQWVASGRRLQEARTVVGALRIAQVRSDGDEIERLLGRLENILGGDVSEVRRHPLRLPQPRVTEARAVSPEGAQARVSAAG